MNYKGLISISVLILLFNGCIGRTVVYEPDRGYSSSSSKKDYIPDPQDFSGENSDFVKFIYKHNPRIDNYTAENIAKYTSLYCQQYNIAPKLVLALIARESSFRVKVVSSSGAIGLGQLLGSTAQDMGVDPYDAEGNIKGTVLFLSRMLKMNNGDIKLALASYKLGPFAVKKIVTNGQNLPYTTQQYIDDIFKYQGQI